MLGMACVDLRCIGDRDKQSMEPAGSQHNMGIFGADFSIGNRFVVRRWVHRFFPKPRKAWRGIPFGSGRQWNARSWDNHYDHVALDLGGQTSRSAIKRSTDSTQPRLVEVPFVFGESLFLSARYYPDICLSICSRCEGWGKRISLFVDPCANNRTCGLCSIPHGTTGGGSMVRPLITRCPITAYNR